MMTTKEILENIKEKTWYMQGGEIVPFFSNNVYVLGPITLGHKGMIAINQGTFNWGYLDKLREKEFADEHIASYLKNQNYLKEKIEQMREKIIVYEEHVNELLTLKPEETEKLKQLVKEIGISLVETWDPTFTIDQYDPWEQHYLEECSSKYNLSPEETAAMAYPNEYGYEQREKIEFLEIVENKNKEKLKEHHKNYYWFKTSWQHVITCNLKYFEEKYEEQIKNSDKLKKEVDEIKNHFEESKKEKQRLQKKYNFDDKTKKTFEFFSELSDFRDLRKYELTSKFNYLLYQFLIKLAEHNKQEVKLLENSALFEINSYDLSEEYIKELKKRNDELSVICYKEDNTPYFIYDEDAKKIKEALEEQLRINNKEIKGRVAFSGKVKGTAKIINSIHDMKKMNEGDIIISIMTRPELVPAMKKAAAIVTDEGGVTCHAAVISRELKIPCIVGTQVVTQIIKDNDEIEVDADNGIVRTTQ